MDETKRKFSALTKEDAWKLQVLQNKVLRLKSGNYDLNVPTSVLLEATGDLSVQQLGAFHTTLTVFKIIQSREPAYLAEKLTLRKAENNGIFPPRHLNTIQVHCDLTISRSGFLYRGARIWNQLPSEMRQETRLAAFKVQLRKWIISNVPVKPP